VENNPKLILLNGYAGVGKTTIAKRYIEHHPLTLNIEGDQIIIMLGQWLSHEEQAREYVFALTKSMITTHLNSGKTVILPYLLVNAHHAEEFESIAKQNGASFFEVYLSIEKETAIKQLMERGTWGEVGLPPLTEKDYPEINKLYDMMVEETAKRPQTITIHPLRKDIDGTYKLFLRAIGEDNRE